MGQILKYAFRLCKNFPKVKKFLRLKPLKKENKKAKCLKKKIKKIYSL